MPPKPQKLKGTAAAKPPAAAKKKAGAKAPFAKPRKAPSPKRKPEGMSEEAWVIDQNLRAGATADRQKRRLAQKERERLAGAASTAAAIQSQSQGSEAGNPEWARPRGSPSTPGYYGGDTMTPLSRFSPDWTAVEHGGFNPNNIFDDRSVDLNRDPSPSPSTMPMRRGPLL
jgi:hypothetical protein